MKAGLTKSQRAMYEAIKALTVDGLAPTYDELAQHLGIKSRGHVSGHLNILRDKGWITFEHKARSIRIIDDGQPTEFAQASTDRLRGVIEEATEALAAQIGRTEAADILAKVLGNQRAMVRTEADQREPGHPHRFTPKPR